jgi:endoglucanase
MKRRSFLKNSGLAAAAVAAFPQASSSFNTGTKNKLPLWKGFNLLDFYSPDPNEGRSPTTEARFKYMRDWGFNFVRIPIPYPRYLTFDRSRNITPDEVYQIDESQVDKIDSLVSLAHKYGMHVSINLHRAPGYCINAGFHEPYNLWKDKAAQDAFAFHWAMWAKRYKNVSPARISFDLVNEPAMREDMNDQHARSGPIPPEIYRAVVKQATESIRQEKPDALVIADGNEVGNKVSPQLIDLNIAQSCRGYSPHIISHYKAPWAMKDTTKLPQPKWPGQVGDQYLSREMLEKYYAPWIELVSKGVGVHCGECGAWIKTPHEVFLSWFADVADILTSNGIGFALWEFSGDFGVLNSRRDDVVYEDWYGEKLDRKLLDLITGKH